MTTYELVLPYARPPLNLNQRLHHMAKYRLNEQIKDDVHKLALAARLPKLVAFVTVELLWCPPDNRTRDTDNPTPTLKSAIDGLKRYGLVADDDSRHVRSWCTIGPKHPVGGVTLNITIHPATESDTP